MKNRIRHYRRQRQMTLKELADSIGTTPQTVSRLETEVMTLSTDWLERLARALGVHVSELLDTPERPDIPVLGLLGPTGALVRTASGSDRLILDVRSVRPVAVRLGHNYGVYRSGEVLVGTRLDGAEIARGLGHDCLCCLEDGRLMLRRLIQGEAGRYTLVPLGGEDEIRYNQSLLWAAQLVLRLEYL